MTVDILLDTLGTALSAERSADLSQSIDRAAGYLDRRATLAGAIWPPVRVLVVDDFVAAVQDVLDRLNGPSEGPGFATMRMGGTTAAKTMPDPLHEGGSLIVMDASLATLDDPAIVGVPIVNQTFLIAHELAHVLIGAVRDASGVFEALPPARTDAEHFAQWAVRIAADEYRADMLAADAIGASCYVITDEGERVPAPVAATAAIGFLSSVVDDISALHPSLADTVDRYRHHQMSLEDLWNEVQRATTQALNVLAHAQASLDCGFPEKRNLLTIEPFESRAAELYFRDLWGAIHPLLATAPALPSAEELARTEPLLLDAGQESVAAFWGLLGITVEPLPDGSDYIRVGAPTR